MHPRPPKAAQVSSTPGSRPSTSQLDRRPTGAPARALHFSSPRTTRLSRTNERVQRESRAVTTTVHRVADLSEFPPSAQPVLIKSTFEQIMAGFANEGRDFASLSLCAEVAYNESLEVTAQLPFPNPLRTAVACHLLDRLTPCGPGSTTFSPLLAELKQDVFCSIYSNTRPSQFSTTHVALDSKQARVNHRSAGTHVSADTAGVSRLLNQATYYQDYHAQLKRYTELQEEYESQMLTNDKQKVVLARVITRWQSMLVDRLFAAWRNFASGRGQNLDRRGASAVRAARKSRLARAFTQWRDFTRDTVEERLLEELHVTRTQVTTIGHTASGEKENLAAELAHTRTQLRQQEEELAQVRSMLQTANVTIEQQERRLKSLSEEKGFWRAVALRALARTAPADRTMRLPEECVLKSFETPGDESGASGSGDLFWSPSIMGELAQTTTTDWSSDSSFTAASLQTQVTTAALGIVASGEMSTVDDLSPHNPFRPLLKHLPVPMQAAVMSFDSPAALVTVPSSLLLLGWINSVIQRGSVVYERLCQLKSCAPTQPRSPRTEIVLPTNGEGGAMAKLLGGMQILPAFAATNLSGDMASGLTLMMLAEALGCFQPADFGIENNEVAPSVVTEATLPALGDECGGRLARGPMDARSLELMHDALLVATLKASPDLRVQCACNALFYRIVAHGTIATHGIDPFSVCTGRASAALVVLLGNVLRCCSAMAFDSTTAVKRTFAAPYLSRHRRKVQLGTALEPDEYQDCVASLQAAVTGRITSGDIALRDADEQQLVLQYVERQHAFEAKWGWIEENLVQNAIAMAARQVAAATAAPSSFSVVGQENSSVQPELSAAVTGMELTAEPLSFADHGITKLALDRAVDTVRRTPTAKQLGRGSEGPVADEALSLSVDDGLEQIFEVLVTSQRQLEHVFRSYAGPMESGEPPILTHTRFQQFLTDHSLFSQRHFPKKHAGSLFEALLGHRLPDEEHALAATMAPFSAMGATDVGVDVADRSFEPGTKEVAVATGLNSKRFGAAIVYVAASASTLDVLNLCVQSASSYGAGAGKPPPNVLSLVATKLRTLLQSLSPMAGTSSLSVVQAAIYHPDVQHALSRSNSQLLRLFSLAAGQDDDPEMSKAEFLKLMTVAKLDAAVSVAELERIFAFFAHDDGDGPSMVYRDFLEALVVVVQHVSPSPLTPLADRVRAFLRRREGSFITLATAALALRRVAKR